MVDYAETDTFKMPQCATEESLGREKDESSLMVKAKETRV